MTLSIEDLPAPFGPMMARIFVLLDVEGDALERNHPAKGERDVVDLEDRPAGFPACGHVERKEFRPLSWPRLR